MRCAGDIILYRSTWDGGWGNTLINVNIIHSLVVVK